jgi:drug/metabolite transporter (DMT)-like permease
MYNISQKSTPKDANLFSGLIVSYLVATIVTIILSMFFKAEKSIIHSFSNIHWTSIALGVSIVGVEFGYLLAYRAGWNISIGSLLANILLALMLIPVGIIFYKEGFEINKLLGIILCIVGLIIISK